MQPLYISHDCAILGMAMETEVTGTTDPAMEVGVQVEVTALEVPSEVFQAEVQPLVVPVQHLDMEVPVEDKKNLIFCVLMFHSHPKHIKVVFLEINCFYR